MNNLSVNDILFIANLSADSYEDWSTVGESSVEELMMIPLIFGLLLLFGLAGNGTVMYVVAYDGPSRSVTNIYLLSLATADLLFLLFSLPFTAALHLLPSWPFGENLCKSFYATTKKNVINFNIIFIIN